MSITTTAGVTFLRNRLVPNGAVPFTVYAWGAQLEAAPFASSYIPTTSASVIRNEDVLNYPTSGNIASAQGAVSFDLNPYAPTSQVGIVFAMNGLSGYIAPVTSGTLMRFFDGLNNNDWATIQSPNTVSKWALSWGGGLTHMYRGGTQLSPANNSLNASFAIGANLNIGYVSGLANTQLSGTIRNVKIWKKALTNTQLQNMTSSGVTSIAKSVVPQTTVKSTGGTGLVGWWKFDEGTGTRANDSSGLGNSGTLVSSPTWTNGKLGKALNFNGSSQFVSVPNNATLNPSSEIAISAWTYFTSVGTGSLGVVGKAETPAQSGYVLGTLSTGTKMRFYPVNANTNYVESLTNITTNQWAHWTATYDGTTAKIYLNGVLDNSASITGPVGTNTQPLVIGRWYGNYAGYNFPGKIDDVRVYSRALSQAEITALYKSTAAVVNAPTNTSGGSLTSGLVGLWSFDGKDMNWGTNKALDRSGSGNNGTLVSMSTTTSPVIGKIGQALKFNGSNSNVSATSVSSLNFGTGNFTVSQWIKFSDLGTGSNGFISKDNYSPGTTYNGWLMNICTGCVPGGVGLETRNLVSGSGPDTHARYAESNFTVGQWYHLVGIRSSGTLYLYVNGVLRSTAIEGSATNVTNSQNLLLGSLSAGAPQWFTGSLDDVRVYNRALTATEVKALYNLGR